MTVSTAGLSLQDPQVFATATVVEPGTLGWFIERPGHRHGARRAVAARARALRRVVRASAPS